MCENRLYLYTLVMNSPKWKLRKQFHLLYTMEYYSDIKRNEIGSFVEMCMDLETIIQSEIKSKREKQISYINTYMWNLEKCYGLSYL